MSFQVGDTVKHLTHSERYGTGIVSKVGVELLSVSWQKHGDVSYYKDGRFQRSGPIAIQLLESVNYVIIPNLGKLFTLECGTRILKGTDGRLLQLANSPDV